MYRAIPLNNGLWRIEGVEATVLTPLQLPASQLHSLSTPSPNTDSSSEP